MTEKPVTLAGSVRLSTCMKNLQKVTNVVNSVLADCLPRMTSSHYKLSLAENLKRSWLNRMFMPLELTLKKRKKKPSNMTI